MGALKTIFAGLFAIAVIVGGLFVAAFVALAGMTLLIVRRLLGRTGPQRPTFRRPRVEPGPANSEVIDVVAAEIPESR